MTWARIRRGLGAVKAALGAVGVTPARLFAVLTLGLFLAQNAQVLFYISANADARAIVRAFDDDAGNAVDVVGRSTWVTDNGFASYGPVYFRVASTVSTWLKPITAPDDLPKAEARTKSDHFGLMLTSLLAVALMSLLFARGITRDLSLSFLIAALFEWALLRSVTWQYMILKAHPDHLLALIVAGVVILSARGWRDPENLHLRHLSAWGWGTALATKASIILFTPVVGLTFLATQTRARTRRALAYVGHVALAYFAVGFPQNFNLPRLFRFLTYQSGYSKPATVESAREWMTLLTDQAWAPLALTVGLLALAPRRRPSGREIGCGLALAVFPFVALLPQRVLAPHEHYPMPVVATVLSLLLVIGRDRSRPLTRESSFVITTLSLGFFFTLGLVPRGFDEVLGKELRCRPEARQVFRAVLDKTSRGEKVYADPYVPISAKMPNVTVNWRTTANLVATEKFDALVLNRPYFVRYFDDARADYVGVYNAERDQTRAFYQIFRADVNEVNDERVGHWRRESVRCDWEVWTRAAESPQ